MVRPALRVAGLAGLLVLALAAPTAAQHPSASTGSADRVQHQPVHQWPVHQWPDHLPLPDGFAPEGIAIGRRPVAWLGSRLDGDILRLDLRTGASTVVSQGPGTASLGMKVDDRGRLFVAGGDAGDGRVIDTRSGAVLASYRFTAAASFVNDVVLAGRTAWFTDSSQAQLYGVVLGRHGRLPVRAVTLPLGGEWDQGTGFGPNGIATTPDHRALLVVHTTTGLLYRVDPRTGAAIVVDLGGVSLRNGDGLLRRGRTLYVVRNVDEEVDVVRLDRRGGAGRVVRTLTSDDFAVPTTIAAFGRSLYLPNARFDAPDATEFWVTRISRCRH